MKNLPNDVESTRVSNDLDDEEEIVEKTPKPTYKIPPNVAISSTKKTPASSTKTPQWKELCDSDTPSESESEYEDSDDEFNPNETKNASSSSCSEDDEEEKPKIRKTKSRKFEEDFVFIPPTEVKKSAVKNLTQFEFQEPPKMPGIDTPKKPTKKKLFTHNHYDDDEDQLTVDSRTKESDNNKENERVALPIPPKTNKKVQRKVETPKTVQPVMKFQKYSFLKSLDCETTTTIRSLCDPLALYLRDNYKTKKVELAKKLFELYNESVFENKLDTLEIRWNKKLLNTAGRCNNHRKNGVRNSFLELSDKVLTSADRLRCTLIHEMCHAATWILNGESSGHGVTWKGWAAKANRVFPELPVISRCHDYAIEYRYTYQCVNCKAKYQAHSKNKKVENIRCSICKSAIELFLNKKNKDGEIVMTPVAKDVKGFPKFVKLKFKDVKKPNMTHKEVMQCLSQQYAALSVDEKQKLYA